MGAALVARAVVDANALLVLVLNDDRQQLVAEAVSRLDGDQPIHGPYLLVSEVANALHRAVRVGVISRQDAGLAARELDRSGIVLYRPPSIAGLLSTVEELGQASAYDATYVALATSLRAPLLTLDQRLARSAEAHGLTLLLDL